jgi:small subunit ribosomal protein S16
MLKIRLTRRGKKNKAFFRLVVAEHTSPIKGKFIEALGFLNPHTKENSLKSERVKFWIEKGAQCSDSAHNMLVKAGILKGPKRAVKMKKKEEIKTEEKTVPEEKPARIATQSVAGGEEKIVAPKKEAPKKEKEADKKKEKTDSKEEKKEIAGGENE